ncbi:YigZ family protein [Corynebacterium macginleyi]|uniref:YigZ family protein n=1 Tax=Corynebacterium macginleyi TaxID=38290 RepID=A0A3M0H055_9CORY|nr:YigZ family protein [Corynebacterium macginleyi]MBK4141719.1 YigZ family protein [Corynebacterium macginleyi]MBK4152085.1 YigZ family protein [Corynebacterium macginleyi]MBK4157291.1 YigZ family protein [Corynebacterium macginleyi]MBK4161582.1 YigZ family protein [Corynebacterium macginleyi]MBK4162578.1 YigZ family protein [Corynebacterium macginleyi]
MRDTYRRPTGQVEHEIEIKRSRFITLIGRVTNEDEARAFIDAARQRFPDARHHCSAYVYHVDDANPVERFSDDGEPSGTAGKPMLDVVKGSGMLDICAVVVRYFGGIKLGAGGLVHAYGGAVSEAIEKVEAVTRGRRELYTVECPHATAGRLEADLRGRGINITDTDYGRAVTFTVAVRPGGLDELQEMLAALSQGQISAHEAGSAWVEVGSRT